MTPLFGLIAEHIRETGPIGIDRYMELCLNHPQHGYYRTRDPFGASGDFVTAPEISQMFGELIGVWIAATRATMGNPEPLHLVELGPGRGTLMADAARALAAAAPDARFDIHLVETSPALRDAQGARLAGLPSPVSWHADIGSLPEGPAIVVANEFFDALPLRQFQRTERGWHERVVGLSTDGARLAFGLSPEPDRSLIQAAPVGALLNVPSAAIAIVRSLAARFVGEGGVLLAVDYGHVRPAFGDTFQAVAGHRFADPLEAPGEADLTHHVDFPALARAAEAEGARVHGPIDQRDLLLGLGLRVRADRLKLTANPAQAQDIETAVARLTDPDPRGMGALFKAFCLSHPTLTDVPAFPGAAA